jgi:superfamily II DNA/RNA helicase
MSPTFAELGVPAPLVAALSATGIDSPFPIQRDTLPDTLAGKDVLGRGRTGSGKTLAFALPMVARLSRGGSRPGHPRALVLAPTRELATQIAAVVAPLAATSGLSVTTIFGGVGQAKQERALAEGVDIVVACPGRLEDLVRQKVAMLDAIEVTVLDEADHMADLGFLPGVTRLMTATPPRGQRMLFSATLDRGVDRLVTRFLHQPVTHSVDSVDSPVASMVHEVLMVSDVESKRQVVESLAAGAGPRILFMRTKHGAKKLARQLQAVGIGAVELQGNLSQAARERNLGALRDGRATVLVATDVAARGVHIDDVTLVVHVDPPVEHKSYLHRSGRTARAGAAGTVVTLVLPEQRREVTTMLRAAAIKAVPQQVTPSSPVVLDLAGERLPARSMTDLVAAPQTRPAARGAGAGKRGGAGRGQQQQARGRRGPAVGGAGTRSEAAGPVRSGAGRSGGSGARSTSTRGAAPARSAGGSASRGSAPVYTSSSAASASAAPRSGGSWQERSSRRAGRPAGPVSR